MCVCACLSLSLSLSLHLSVWMSVYLYLFMYLSSCKRQWVSSLDLQRDLWFSLLTLFGRVVFGDLHFQVLCVCVCGVIVLDCPNFFFGVGNICFSLSFSPPLSLIHIYSLSLSIILSLSRSQHIAQLHPENKDASFCAKAEYVAYVLNHAQHGLVLWKSEKSWGTYWP